MANTTTNTNTTNTIKEVNTMENTNKTNLSVITKEDILKQFSVINENDEVTDFDLNGFLKFVDELNETVKQLKAENKKQEKEEKKAKQAENDKAGKEYYDSLEEGATFVYITSKNEKVVAKKIKPKSDKRAACEVISGLTIEEGKTSKRYPMFRQIVIETVEETEETETK